MSSAPCGLFVSTIPQTFRRATVAALLMIAILTTATAQAAPRVSQLPKLPRQVPGEILVGLADSVRLPAEALFRTGQPLAAAMADRSPSLDRLLSQFGVRDVKPVFRPAEEGAAAALPTLAQLRQRQAAAFSSIQAAKSRPATPAPDLVGVYRLRLAAGGDVAAAAAAFRADPHVRFAEPNGLATTAGLPNDPYVAAANGDWKSGSWRQPYADSWGLQRIGWGAVWQRQAALWPDPARRGGGGITVAVVDTGVDTRHPDLAANVWRDAAGPGRDWVDVDLADFLAFGLAAVPGEDYTTPDADPADHLGHGTHVAGTIAAVAGNGRGIAGVAWRAKVLAERAGFALQAGEWRLGFFSADNIAAAVRDAVDRGADVINMSFGGTGDEPQTLALAFQYAHAAGVVLVAAAGNSDDDAAGYYPASDPYVLAVAATMADDRRVGFSNWGAKIALAAPGADIVSLRAAGTELDPMGHLANDTLRASGTSMAAPFVSGAVALVLSRFPGIAPAEAAARVVATARPLADLAGTTGATGAGTPQWALGSGRLDLMRALAMPAQPVVALQSLAVTDAGVGGTVRLHLTLIDLWRPANGVAADLAATARAVAGVTGGLRAAAWPAGEVRSFDAEVAAAGGAPWGSAGGLHLAVRSDGFTQDLPLPFTVNGPRGKAGWPVRNQDWDALATAPALGDLDGDGRPEVVTLSANGEVAARRADGTLLRGWPVRLAAGDELSSPLVADLAHDGHREVVLARGNQVHALDAAGRELPGWPRTIDAALASSPAAGDLTGHGRLAVVVATARGTLYAFDPGGAPLAGFPRRLGASSVTPALADLDGDGVLDVVAGSDDGRLWALKGNGGTVAGRWPARLPSLAALAVGDLDGDGKPEVVAVDAAGAVYRVDRRGAVRKIALLPGNGAPAAPILADLDGDGRLDIVVATASLDGSGFLSALDGTGRQLAGWPVLTADQVAAAPAVADFAGDGRPQVVAMDAGGRLHAVRADGQPYAGWPLRLTDFSLSSPVLADLDGDGVLDLVVGGMSSGASSSPDAPDAPPPFVWAVEFGHAGRAWPTLQADPQRTGRAPG